MAVVGHQLEIMRDGDANVAVKRDVIVDPKAGVVLERKMVVAEVPLDDGRVALVAGQKIDVAPLEVNIIVCTV